MTCSRARAGSEIDPCRPATGSDKGKAERGVRPLRSAFGEVLRRGAGSLEELGRRLDDRAKGLMDRLTCSGYGHQGGPARPGRGAGEHHEREHYQRHEYRREVLHLIPYFRSAATGAAGDRLGRGTRTPAVPRQSSTCGMGTEVTCPRKWPERARALVGQKAESTSKDQALQEAMEARLAEADPTPGRCWNPWETARIHGVDTAGIDLLRVRVWRFRRPRIPGAGGCLAPLRCVSQPTQC